MGKKKVKNEQESPKEAIGKKGVEKNPAAKVTDPLPQEAKPNFWAYLKATMQLLITWVKAHKRTSLLLAVVVLAVAAGLFWVLRPGQEPLTHDEIVIQINKELSIQGDGNPVILTVEDKNKATQPFLQQAVNGDKVLLYYKAKRAVLYRPSEKRVVHQGTYTPPDAKVFIRKGTAENSPVESVKNALKSVSDITIASEDMATKTDYQGTVIVHVTDRYDEKVRELSDKLQAKIVRMPAGESFPDADIMILVGN